MKKRIVVVLALALALVFSLCGCSETPKVSPHTSASYIATQITTNMMLHQAMRIF